MSNRQSRHRSFGRRLLAALADDWPVRNPVSSDEGFGRRLLAALGNTEIETVRGPDSYGVEYRSGSPAPAEAVQPESPQPHPTAGSSPGPRPQRSSPPTHASGSARPDSSGSTTDLDDEGGRITVGGDAADAVVYQGHGVPAHPEPYADIGVLTVVASELAAVVRRLRRYPTYRSERLPEGSTVHRAMVPTEEGDLRVAVMQTLGPGSRSAAVASQRMLNLYRPSVLLLVGIARGIREDLAVGDVVIGDEVIYFDWRQEPATGQQRRANSRPVTPFVQHRLNEFFAKYGNVVPGDTEDGVRVVRGPIGSGDATVADRYSDVVAFRRRFNDKVLAVETEAGAVGQAFYEQAASGGPMSGWLIIRGISDFADPPKGQDPYEFAAERAALVMDRLLPLLGPPVDRTGPSTSTAAESTEAET